MLKLKLLLFLLILSISGFSQKLVNFNESNFKLTLSGKASESSLLDLPQFKNKNFEFTLLNCQEDAANNFHCRYKIAFDGIPIKGFQITSHYKPRKSETVFIIPKAMPGAHNILLPSSKYAYKDAVAKIKTIVKSNKYKKLEPSSECNDEGLIFVPKDYNFKKPQWVLAYEIDVSSMSPLQSKRISIEVETGKVIFVEERLCSFGSNSGSGTHTHTKACNEHAKDLVVEGTAVTRYHGTRTIETTEVDGGFVLDDQTRGTGITTENLNTNDLFFDEDNFWNNANANLDEIAGDAHWGTEATFDFYRDQLNLDGFDGAGRGMNSIVHLSDANAYWDGSSALYGDGTPGGTYDLPFTYINIIGHEVAHAVTEFSSGLIYAGESGGMNESISDIIGMSVEHFTNPGSVDWLLGEDVSTSGTYFRNMANPKEVFMPDTYQGEYWEEFGDVHFSSAIGNYWFYLLVTGGSGTNDNGLDYTIESIGWEKAWTIAHNTWTQYLISSSSYPDCANFALEVTSDLYGACSFELEQVANAWEAVGVLSTGFDPAFRASTNFICEIPASIQFSSTGPVTEFLWDFGDGTQSTEANPSHIYNELGMYTVSLSGSDCNNTPFSIVEENFIIVDTMSSFCDTIIMMNEDQSISSCAGVILDEGGNDSYRNGVNSTLTIQNANVPGYRLNFAEFQTEFCCDVLTISSFDNGDLIFTEAYRGTIDPFEIYIPGDEILLNFTSDGSVTGSGYVIDFECLVPMIPEADFTANRLDVCAPLAALVDNSTNFPTSWTWLLDNVEVSDLRNPEIILPGQGVFDIALIACNDLGCDTLIRPDYITYNEDAPFCDTLVMVNNETITSADCQGVIIDDGGPGNYGNNVFSTINLEAANAPGYILDFESFDVESGWDYLRIFVDNGSGYQLVESYTGFLDPFTLEISSPKVRLQWGTDGSVTRPGFVINYECLLPSIPDVEFSANNTVVCDPFVSLFDESEDYPNSWTWLINGEVVSTEQNPVIPLTDPGFYDVELIGCNTEGCDTLLKPDYIYFDPEASFCDTIILEDNMTVVSNSCEGVLVDDGGLNNNYDNNVFSILDIESPGTGAYEIDFDFFNTESGWDYLRLYTDNGNGFELFNSYNGNLQAFSITVVASRIRFEWDTDGSVTRPGFVISWQCENIDTPPVANFSAEDRIVCDGVVSLVDESTGFGNSWTWLLDGVEVSNDPNPTVTLPAIGSYDVSLIACNVAGCDTLTELDFVGWDDQLPECDIITMEDDLLLVVTDCEGVLVDDGGTDGNYDNSVFSIVDIEVPNAVGYILDFEFFETEGGWDFLNLEIDDGTGYVPYAQYDGVLNPFSLEIYTSRIRFVWDTDGSITRPGFIINWTCLLDDVAPLMNATFENQECSNTVFFNSNAINADLVNWDFGDGNFGEGISIEHTYATSGSYTVGVEAVNENGTTTSVLEVEAPVQALDFNVMDTVEVNSILSSFISSHLESETTSIGWLLDGALFSNEHSINIIIDEIGTHVLTCQVVDINGCSVSHSETIEGVMISSLGNPELLKQIKLFPNPTNSMVNIENLSALQEAYSISLINTIGQTISTQTHGFGTDKVRLDLSKIPSGVYLVRIEGDRENLLFKKLVKVD